MPFSLECNGPVFPVEFMGFSSWRDFGVTASGLRQYKRAVQRWYRGKETDGDGKHDIGHIARVLVHASILSSWLIQQGAAVDPDVIFCSVVLHDAKSNHCDTPNHGDVAADYFRPLLRNVFPTDKARHIENIIRWHSKRASDVPWWIRTPEFMVVTGADALDLVRMADGREILVTTPDAWQLRHVAQTLYKRSTMKPSGDAFEDVLTAVEEMGLLAHCG